MKLLQCLDCKQLHSIHRTSTGMCECGHCFFCVHSWNKEPNKDGKLIIIGSKVVWVWGPCVVWYASDKELKAARPGDIVQFQLMRDPHPNVKRVNKGEILFKDQPDLLKESRNG